MAEEIKKITSEDDEGTAYEKYLIWLYDQYRQMEDDIKSAVVKKDV